MASHIWISFSFLNTSQPICPQRRRLSWRDRRILNAADNFNAVITTPARRNKPSWMLVAAKDRTTNPHLEPWYAARVHRHVVELAGANHSLYGSHPKEVADLIKSVAGSVPK
jgi:pimeloyl-ACP methyl ester carboxylesterase